MRALRLLLVLVLAAPWLGGNALAAITRVIPANAPKMVMVFTGIGAVTVKKGGIFTRDVVYQLSPGSQIRDINNRILLPSHVAGEYKVRAQIDKNGEVHRVWILTPEEIALPDPKQ